MRPFSRLLITDLRNIGTTLITTLSIFAAAHVILIYFLISSSTESMFEWFTVTNSMTLAASFIVPIVLSFTIWTNEWKGHHQLLLLPLPVSKAQIFTSKFISILISYALLFVTVACFFAIEMAIKSDLPGIGEIFSEIGAMEIFSQAISWASVTLLAFFSYLLGKSMKRLSGMITFFTFVIMLNLPSLLAFRLEPKEAPVNSVNLTPGMVTINGETITALPLALNVVLGVLYVVGSLYLLNRKIEA